MKLYFALTFLSLIFLGELTYANIQTKIDSLENSLITISVEKKPDLLIKLARSYWRISQDKTREYAEEAFQLAKETNNKTAEANVSIVLSSFYIFSSIEKAEEYAKNALALGKELELSNVEIGALVNIGVIHYNQGKKEKAIDYYQKALDISIAAENHKKSALIYSNIGTAYKDLAEYEKAIDLLQNSIDIREKIEDKTGLAFSLHMIGIIYKEWGNNEEALKYYKESLLIKEEIGDKYGTIFSMNALGQIYNENQEYHKALESFQKALQLSEAMNNKRIIAGALNNIGAAYNSLGEYSKALVYYEKSIKIKEQLNDNEGKISSLENIGQVYLAQKKYTKALQFFNKSLDISENNNIGISEMNAYKHLSKVYSQMGNKSKAFKYFKQYNEIKDSVFSAEKHEQIVEMQTKYETAKKENEIVILNAEKKAKDIALRQQKLYTTSLASGLMLVFVFFIILAFQYKQKQTAYKNLVQKNMELIRNEDKSIDKYQKSGLQTNEIENLVIALSEKMKMEKAYLNSDINIALLSKQLNTNSKYLSQAINTKFNMNFNQFLNGYRIKESQRLLADKENNKLSIEGIATTVGFNSKATFNTAFRKQTGVTPSFYKKSLQQEEA